MDSIVFAQPPQEPAVLVVILPGLDGTGTLHQAFCDAMRMQLPDVRMQVMAYPSQTPLTYQQLATLVRAQLPESGDVVILGESFSGPIALALAADPPPNVLALVLTTTFAKLPAPYFSLLAPLSRWLPIGVLPSSWVAPWLLARILHEVARK